MGWRLWYEDENFSWEHGWELLYGHELMVGLEGQKEWLERGGRDGACRQARCHRSPALRLGKCAALYLCLLMGLIIDPLRASDCPPD